MSVPEYVRVYQAIRDDPRFATIYSDNDRLATWLRLLMEADALWPAPAPIPRTVDEQALAALVDAGIIDLMPHDHYRVHGLDAERERRSEQGRAGGLASGVVRGKRTNAERPFNERRTKMNKTSTSTSTSTREGTSRAAPRDGLARAPKWRPFLDAWRGRGLRHRPTQKQHDALWDVVDARPSDAVRWVAEAPAGAKAADVVGYVLEQWRAFRVSIPPDEPAQSIASNGAEIDPHAALLRHGVKPELIVKSMKARPVDDSKQAPS
jgi:hypothetical protein